MKKWYRVTLKYVFTVQAFLLDKLSVNDFQDFMKRNVYKISTYNISLYAHLVIVTTVYSQITIYHLMLSCRYNLRNLRISSQMSNIGDAI